MQSVCQESDRLGYPSTASLRSKSSPLGLHYDERFSRQTCSCNLNVIRTGSKTFPTWNRFDLMPKPEWKLKIETQSSSHYRSCPFFATSAKTHTARICIKSCGVFLAGAIEVSIAIKRGAGGLSIGPKLQCAQVVPHDSPAFRLIEFDQVLFWHNCPINNMTQWDAFLHSKIKGLESMFSAGKASPYDVDLNGNTLLHVRSFLCYVPRICYN